MRFQEIDEIIGKAIRRRRQELGMSQDALGKEIGITFQQIQKYEKGINGVSAARLVQISAVLRIEPESLLLHQSGHVKNASDREALEMTKCFHRLKDYERKALSKLAHSLAAGAQAE